MKKALTGIVVTAFILVQGIFVWRVFVGEVPVYAEEAFLETETPTSIIGGGNLACQDALIAKVNDEEKKFQSKFEEFALLKDTPPTDLLIRLKTAIRNLEDTANTICSENINATDDGSSIREDYRVSQCLGVTKGQNTLIALRNACSERIQAIISEKEILAQGFIQRDAQSKKAFTYAETLERINGKLRKLNEDLIYVEGNLGKMLGTMNFLKGGSQAGE